MRWKRVSSHALELSTEELLQILTQMQRKGNRTTKRTLCDTRANSSDYRGRSRKENATEPRWPSAVVQDRRELVAPLKSSFRWSLRLKVTGCLEFQDVRLGREGKPL
jgi:hypothetical protein